MVEITHAMKGNFNDILTVIPAWIESKFDKLTIKGEKKTELIKFWTQFYVDLLKKNPDLFEKSESKINPSRIQQYKIHVCDLLDKDKFEFPMSEEQLIKLQKDIECSSMFFDEESIYKSFTNIVLMLIKDDGKNARDYLRSHKSISKEDSELLSEFGQYTLEGLIVYVLGLVFNPVQKEGMVRLATLVNQLELEVRNQAALFRKRRYKNKNKNATTAEASKEERNTKEEERNTKEEVFKENCTNKKKERKEYPFGSCLIEFMRMRELISIFNEPSSSVKATKKGDSYFIPKHLFVYCNFNIAMLPIQLNLPMVCKPVDWKPISELETPRTLDGISGGYLCHPMGDFYERYRLLSSSDHNHFYIDFKKGDPNFLCNVMNKLQSQGFEINSPFLRYIKSNEDKFVKNGLLVPKFLFYVNVKETLSMLREYHMQNPAIIKLCSYSELIDTFCKDVQCARYEQFILKLACAYEGYKLYLPAFLDFRGRIYRCGILHFHERDLARSLIRFSDEGSKEEVLNKNQFQFLIRLSVIGAATAFHYKSFLTVREAEDYFLNHLLKKENELDYVKTARDAKKPFQLLSNIVSLNNLKNNLEENIKILNKIPITQDASASAYQIISYFTMDTQLAALTNLIPNTSGQIQDIYQFFKNELIEFIRKEVEMDTHLKKIVREQLTRKLVKGIFMPIIYGKTIMSTASNIQNSFSSFLTHKECYKVASVCFDFWKKRFSGMYCLIRLIRSIGWLVSLTDRPIKYGTPEYTTVQDYMIMEPINIWVYDRIHKKRRKVTLRVSSSNRDRRKTEISTFVNFIHQKDANIAMRVVDIMQKEEAPLYTVHDNFITTPKYSKNVPKVYARVIANLGSPLEQINEFIHMNLISPYSESKGEYINKDDFIKSVISRDFLNYYLELNKPLKETPHVKKRMKEKIEVILDSYESYARIVCGEYKPGNEKEAYENHKERLSRFNSQLIPFENETTYCVHY